MLSACDERDTGDAHGPKNVLDLRTPNAADPPYVAVPKNPSFTWELGRSSFLGGRYESFKAGDPDVPRRFHLTLAAWITAVARELIRHFLRKR